MRIGLHVNPRKVYARKGSRVVRQTQLKFIWLYLVVVINLEKKKVYGRWQSRVNSESLKPNLLEFYRKHKINCLVWDNAPSHKSEAIMDIGMCYVYQPRYSPELQPAERLFQELRKEIEGVRYNDIEEKKAKVESYLRKLNSETERFESLLCWRWVMKAIGKAKQFHATL
jgi:transposase